MDKIIFDFYSGFEGEGEIQFIQFTNDTDRDIIRIWDGYFDDIMENIEPEPEGWIGLAYYYNLAEGWYDDNPWEIPNISEALLQIKQTENSEFRFEKTNNVVKEICNLLSKAIENHSSICIARE